MTISDYQKGTAFIRLVKSDFLDAERFKGYCRFMEAPETSELLIIPVLPYYKDNMPTPDWAHLKNFIECRENGYIRKIKPGVNTFDDNV